ncbi:MAG: HAD hydrolase-like protein, partial [Pseudomonas sp.]|nr:HAD hydrolase-like protein [Pseudomonas sp.]
MLADYKLLIFDWDGTLADSIGRIVEAMQVAAERSDLLPRDDFAVKGIIGLGLPEAIRTLYPEIGDAELVAFRQHYADHYIALEAEPSPLFAGVVESLEAFRSEGYHL